MKARWVLPNPDPRPPLIAQALVASWWPGRFYLVSTVLLDSSSALQRLTHTLTHGGSFENAKPPEVYVTGVFRSNKEFVVKSLDPLYEREYSDLEAAQTGHAEIVGLLEQGRLWR